MDCKIFMKFDQIFKAPTHHKTSTVTNCVTQDQHGTTFNTFASQIHVKNYCLKAPKYLYLSEVLQKQCISYFP